MHIGVLALSMGRAAADLLTEDARLSAVRSCSILHLSLLFAMRHLELKDITPSVAATAATLLIVDVLCSGDQVLVRHGL